MDYADSCCVFIAKCKSHKATFGTLHLLHHFKSYSLLILSSGKPLKANIFVLGRPTWSNNGSYSCNSATADNRTHGFTYVCACVSLCAYVHLYVSRVDKQGNSMCQKQGVSLESEGRGCVFVCCSRCQIMSYVDS